jgi:hypothetical protein
MLNKSARLSLFLSLASLLFLSPANAQQPGAVPKADAVAPFLDDQTLLVARIDFSKLDPAALSAMLGRVAPANDTEFPRHLARLQERIKALQAKLAAAGVSELYALVSLADLPKEPLFIVAPLKADADAARTAEALRETLGFEASDAKAGAAVVGTKRVVERLKNLTAVQRPEFAKGLERAAAAVQVVISPNGDTRRVIREMLPRLPDEIGGSPGKLLSDGLEWATLSLQFPPQASLSLVIQSRDAESAAALRGLIMSVTQFLAAQPEIRKRLPAADNLARLLTPRLSGDQLTLNFSEPGGQMEQALQVFIAPLQAVRVSAGRAQSSNNIKQLGLAMHNYHDTHGRLPPQAIRGQDGRALLSWRVAILPFLDAGGLYKEFRLDEPWDSEHNKPLIEKMPKVFAAPNLGDERIAQGLTSYLAPLTRQPPAVVSPLTMAGKIGAPGGKEMIFDRPLGVKFADITDGTSNTILLVEANPNSAVVWTKPNDLVIDLADPTKDLRGQPDDGFSALIADGSAHFLKDSLDAATLRRLLQMNDGEPIGQIR